MQTRQFLHAMGLSILLALTALAQDELLTGHPRESYHDVADIDAMEKAVREHFAAMERYSFSRSWWQWDRLRARFVDHGRKDVNALKILRAVFRGLIMDRHIKTSRSTARSSMTKNASPGRITQGVPVDH